ncbi:MAG: transglutaminase family protein [Planctomycetales bacterium]|nr:transglutaminase family protein [Planctomycetales bacterium]
MIRVALSHKSIYDYDRPVQLGPQVVRLRPAPHCRTPVTSYSLTVRGGEHFVNWQQDPHSNYLARLVFPQPVRSFAVEIDLHAELTVINPFDFFLEASAEYFPFEYEPAVAKDLKPFLDPLPTTPLLDAFVRSVDVSRRKTIDFLVDLNARMEREIRYLIRLEPGVQTPEETLKKASGSCRDSAWLMVQVLRQLGIAARFTSGYLLQLRPDVESLDGPSGAAEDFTDLHAWTEAYLPGAGWIGLDPTSGLLAGEGHLPLACTPEPMSAAPISGSLGECKVEFRHEMSIERIHEDPRVTKPYTDEAWRQVRRAGEAVDRQLDRADVRLTMGGEPTFVSIDDMEGAEWRTAAVGPTKRRLAARLAERLRKRFAPDGLLHIGMGKWYPGESLPRWAFTCLWRADHEPIWKHLDLLALNEEPLGHDMAAAREFTHQLAESLGVNDSHVSDAYEDAVYFAWRERRLPLNADIRDADLNDPQGRARLGRALERGLGQPVGCVLPLMHQWWNAKPRWASGAWPLRSDHMFLIPGDSPMGLRLPLDSLPNSENDYTAFPVAPYDVASPLPRHALLRDPTSLPTLLPAGAPEIQSRGGTRPMSELAGHESETDTAKKKPRRPLPKGNTNTYDHGVVRTALCVEPRDGRLHVFMPPVSSAEAYLELLAAVEQTAEQLQLPVVIEGYLPPPDSRLRLIKVTPDPGVIEVNVHPAADWSELVEITSGVYEEARLSRLGTEKFDLDGTHTGTGGGNHVVMGAEWPADSPFLRRPDLLRSFVSYWHNHPSLSYLFSGRFIGPTSQAPRVDEGRRDAVYELEIAFQQLQHSGETPPWLVDRVLRNLLVDLTGNTHRAEFCIDKLYSPDSQAGRLGLVEFRGFEMPPHWQMSLTQQLLLRAFVARFWNAPYEEELTDWNTSLHDRWMLPRYLLHDFTEVLNDLNRELEALDSDARVEPEWFEPHFEFRFPKIGDVQYGPLQLELRLAIEPWYVLGEEPGGGGTTRFVDSSVERLQVLVHGNFGDRYQVTCNGRRVPLTNTGIEGEQVAGVRYRAWQPPSCLHPTIPPDEPLIFDIVDTWHERSIGGCRYHVGHPGGLNPGSFPVNAYEAEGRRASRFVRMGHTGGRVVVPAQRPSSRFPLTLDLRRDRDTVS